MDPKQYQAEATQKKEMESLPPIHQKAPLQANCNQSQSQNLGNGGNPCQNDGNNPDTVNQDPTMVQEEPVVIKEGLLQTLERTIENQIHNLNEQTRVHHFQQNSNRELLSDEFVHNHSYPAIVKELNQENFSISGEQLIHLFQHIPAAEEKFEVVDKIADRVKFCTQQHLIELIKSIKEPHYQLRSLKRLQYCPPQTLLLSTRDELVAIFQTCEDKAKAIAVLNA